MQRNLKEKINNKKRKKSKQNSTQFLEQLLFKVLQVGHSQKMQKVVKSSFFWGLFWQLPTRSAILPHTILECNFNSQLPRIHSYWDLIYLVGGKLNNSLEVSPVPAAGGWAHSQAKARHAAHVASELDGAIWTSLCPAGEITALLDLPAKLCLCQNNTKNHHCCY